MMPRTIASPSPVPAPVALEVHRLAQQLLAGVTEEPLDLAVEQHDLALAVHQQQAAGG
jgi:hypothetical protein